MSDTEDLVERIARATCLPERADNPCIYCVENARAALETIEKAGYEVKKQRFSGGGPANMFGNRTDSTGAMIAAPSIRNDRAGD